MSFEKPYMLWLLLVLIIPFINAISRFKKLSNASDYFYQTKEKTAHRVFVLKRNMFFRTVFFSLSYICLIIALSCPYWGTESVPVQKSGRAVSFVFDISWSMTATDIDYSFENSDDFNPEFVGSRLHAASLYASDLLIPKQDSELPAVSVVLTKGSGITVVPLTEDHQSVFTVLKTLSPRLMTTTGSNLASGIESAIASFPVTQARQGYIVLFTDGEQTIDSLEKAVISAVKHGIKVYIVGFGSTQGVKIIAGDGTSEVLSKLHEKELQQLAQDIQNIPSLEKVTVEYFNYNSTLDKEKLQKALTIGKTKNGYASQQTGYEVKSVPRYSLFIGFAILFFILGFICSGIKFSITGISVSIILLLFTSCTEHFEQSFSILQGTLAWYQHDYQKAEMQFLKTLQDSKNSEDKELSQYAIYGLGASYVMQNEEASAIERLESISPDADPALRFASAYNLGVLSYSVGNYNQAVESFKKALLIDSTSVNAKINLELAVRQGINSSNSGKQEMLPSGTESKKSVVKDSIFSIIRENEQAQWKNQEKQETSENSLDY